jgi:hypothetical protein
MVMAGVAGQHVQPGPRNFLEYVKTSSRAQPGALVKVKA